MAEAKMPHPGHEQHLCYLTNLDYQITNPKDYGKMVKDATHFCQICGRAGNDPKNLCKPTPMQT